MQCYPDPRSRSDTSHRILTLISIVQSVESIKKDIPKANIVPVVVDLTSVESIRKGAAEITEPIHARSSCSACIRLCPNQTRIYRYSLTMLRQLCSRLLIVQRKDSKPSSVAIT